MSETTINRRSAIGRLIGLAGAAMALAALPSILEAALGVTPDPVAVAFDELVAASVEIDGDEIAAWLAEVASQDAPDGGR